MNAITKALAAPISALFATSRTAVTSQPTDSVSLGQRSATVTARPVAAVAGVSPAAAAASVAVSAPLNVASSLSGVSGAALAAMIDHTLLKPVAFGTTLRPRP